ncbi:MAG: hypothetical protein ACRD4R_03600 [Candidatus Acidiferrales bacterium]
MTVCEFRFERFNARGNDEYLDRVSALLEDLLEARWVLADAARHPEGGGWWQICLYREFKQWALDRTPR